MVENNINSDESQRQTYTYSDESRKRLRYTRKLIVHTILSNKLYEKIYLGDICQRHRIGNDRVLNIMIKKWRKA